MPLRVRFQYPPGADLSYSVERLGDGTHLDFGDGTFKAVPGTPTADIPERSGEFAGSYAATLDPTPEAEFTDGNYAVGIHDSGIVVALLPAVMYAGDDGPVFPGSGAGGTLTGADVQAALAAQGYSTVRAARLDHLDADVTSRPTATQIDAQLGTSHGSGAWGGGSGGGLTQADVQSALTTQGYTTARAGKIDNLDAAIATRSTYAGGPVASVTAPVTISLAQPLADVGTATVGGALHGAWATAFGKAIRDPIARLLNLFGFGSQSIPLVTFDLDDGANPTSRTPR